jgi:BlaI family transcriptional regulator, penicillinase repressor
MTREKTSIPRISDAEWLIMRVLWAKSPATAKDVVAALDADTRWNPKTVLSLINRLVEKGALSFTKEARTHLYSPKVAERDCVKVESRSFLERVYGGAVQPMLAHFVEETTLTKQDIAELRRILDEKKPAGPRGGKAKP